MNSGKFTSIWSESTAEHRAVLEKISQGKDFTENLVSIAEIITDKICSGGKIVIFGNGGSAADSQHIAAEFVGRFRKEKNALPAIALTTDTSVLTALANDYGFATVFSRQVEALVTEKDIALGISTGGYSENVLSGLEKAREKGAVTVLLTGENFNPDSADYIVSVPSATTSVVQEMHIMIGHFFAACGDENQ